MKTEKKENNCITHPKYGDGTILKAEKTEDFIFSVIEYRSLEQIGCTVAIPVIKITIQEIVNTGVLGE